MRPRVSIILPTRNRPTLARIGVEQALGVLGPDAEVVVADNSDQPIELPRDPRVVRLPPGDRVLTMTENWERALRAARGEWLLVLSDKCRLVEGAIDVLLSLAGPHRIITHLKLPFRQDVPAARLSEMDALRVAPGETTRPLRPERVAVRDSIAGLREWYSTLYYCQYLPMLYNSLVHRSLIDEALRRFAQFFVGTAPDIASSLVLLASTKEYVETSVPAIVIQFPTPQLANWSNGVAWSTGHARRKIFLQEYGGAIGHSYRLPETITGAMAETLLEFKRARPALATSVKFDWSRFAYVVAQEIESSPLGNKLSLHAQLLRATQQEGIAPLAVAQQLRAVVASRAPGAYQRLRRIARRNPSPAVSGWSPSERHPSLEQFLSSLAEECRSFVETKGHGGAFTTTSTQ